MSTMDFTTHRKIGGMKYGKNTKRALGFNFFDLDSETTTVAPAPTRLPISPSSPGRDLLSKDEPCTPSSSPLHSRSPSIRPAHITSHSRSSLSQSNQSQSVSPLKQSSDVSKQAEQAMFDLASSEEEREHDPVLQRPLKKRKTIQPVKRKIEVTVEQQPQTNSKSAKIQRSVLAKKVENVRTTTTAKDTKPEPHPVSRPAPLPAGSLLTTHPSVEPLSDTSESVAVLTQNRAKKAIYSTEQTTKPSIQAQTNEVCVEAAKETEAQQQRITQNKMQSKSKLKQPTANRAQKPVSTVTAQVFVEDNDILEEVNDWRPVVHQSKIVSKTKLNQSTAAKKQLATTNPTSRAIEDSDIGTDDTGDVRPVTRPTKTMSKTKLKHPATPRKQQHHAYGSNNLAASPSCLELTELRLTPKRRSMSISPPGVDMSLATMSPARRGRARRIDRLDAPTRDDSKQSTDDIPAEAEREFPKVRLKRDVGEEASRDPARVPSLPRSESSQTRQAYGRNRNRYGKERSHLGDMVDDLDILGTTSSQEASQQLISQLTATSGSSQLQMQYELETSSSDDAGPMLKLKSIHELRQAGTRNHFDDELELLMGEIDPTSRVASRSSRLAALMTLLKKMSRHDFETIVAERGLDRLTTWSLNLQDKTSKLLLNMVFWCLLRAKNVSPINVRAILRSVAASTGLITNLDTMTQLVKTREENLSKVLVRSLVEFEANILEDQLLATYEGVSIVPAAVVLGALYESLRKLVEAGASNVSIGNDSFGNILVLLEQASQLSQDGTVRNKYTIKLTLSLLQLFAGPLNSDLGFSGDRYVSMGNTLARIMELALVQHEDLVQPVLHFMISICNDRPRVCEIMSSSNFPKSAMSIVDVRFLDLVTATESDKEVDTAMLDSIILSLACLLNLAEHDDQVRRGVALAVNVASSGNNLSNLIHIYNNAAPRLDGATTAAQVQVLVAFGYLSLLICNLCLEESVWKQATELLETCNHNMSDVVASAKELLIHLQAVEMGPGDDSMIDETIQIGSAELNEFTQRFGQILTAVRIG